MYDLIPPSVSRYLLSVNKSSPISSIEALAGVLILVRNIARIQKTNLSRLGIPPFGRKLYHLSISARGKGRNAKGIEQVKRPALSRKAEILGIREPPFDFLNSAYYNFIDKISTNQFDCLVVDYDGTICDLERRFTQPSKQVSEALNGFLEKGQSIVVATGRGQSIFEPLRKVINRESWNHVGVSFYNGACFGTLSSQSCQYRAKPQPVISEIFEYLIDDPYIDKIAEISESENQVTIFPSKRIQQATVWVYLHQLVCSRFENRAKVRTSSHSIDVISKEISKNDCFNHVQSFMDESAQSFLCIGDKGAWPGNDYDLLSSPFSLSVDEVSSNLNTCWNLSPLGLKGSSALLFYIGLLKSESDGFRIVLPKGARE
jgi:HAD superfamily hydrolase (TIGR01484 family)